MTTDNRGKMLKENKRNCKIKVSCPTQRPQKMFENCIIGGYLLKMC